MNSRSILVAESVWRDIESTRSGSFIPPFLLFVHSSRILSLSLLINTCACFHVHLLRGVEIDCQTYSKRRPALNVSVDTSTYVYIRTRTSL